MSPFRNTFSIRALEELSGVKAHTIRIWEKRYGLLAPERTGTNIRHYDLDELKVILNVSFLNQQGLKISHIAALSQSERERLVRETSEVEGVLLETMNALKLAMLTFDAPRFREVCQKHRDAHGFPSLLEDVFAPLLGQIGVLWQTNAIYPAQEHFASNLIRLLLIAETESLPPPKQDKGRTFILHLPENEIHELGLLYTDHLLRARGESTIYLGQSVPVPDLAQLAALLEGPLYMISILTAEPPAKEIEAYLNSLQKTLPESRISFLVMGSSFGKERSKNGSDAVKTYGSMGALKLALDEITT